MSRKSTNSVATISLNIGKNSFHLIDLDGRFGSSSDLCIPHPTGPLSGVKQKQSAKKRTSTGCPSGSNREIPRAAVVRPGMQIPIGGADARMPKRIPHQGHGRAALQGMAGMGMA